MVFDVEKYERFADGILKRIPVMRCEQMAVCLKNYYQNLSFQDVYFLMLSLQQRGVFLMTEDEWLMSKIYYLSVTHDRFSDQIHWTGRYRLPKNLAIYDQNDGSKIVGTLPVEQIISVRDKDLSDAFWLVADMMPESANFFLPSEPWLFAFAKDGRNTKNIDEKADEERMKIAQETLKLERMNGKRGRPRKGTDDTVMEINYSDIIRIENEIAKDAADARAAKTAERMKKRIQEQIDDPDMLEIEESSYDMPLAEIAKHKAENPDENEEDDPAVYQIIKIRGGVNEDVDIIKLDSLPYPVSNKDTSMRDILRRIAIMENPEHAYRLKGKGIMAVAEIGDFPEDPDNPDNHNIVHYRFTDVFDPGERWSM